MAAADGDLETQRAVVRHGGLEVVHGDDDVVQRKCHECSCVV